MVGASQLCDRREEGGAEVAYGAIPQSLTAGSGGDGTATASGGGQDKVVTQGRRWCALVAARLEMERRWLMVPYSHSV